MIRAKYIPEEFKRGQNPLDTMGVGYFEERGIKIWETWYYSSTTGEPSGFEYEIEAKEIGDAHEYGFPIEGRVVTGLHGTKEEGQFREIHWYHDTPSDHKEIEAAVEANWDHLRDNAESRDFGSNRYDDDDDHYLEMYEGKMDFGFERGGNFRKTMGVGEYKPFEVGDRIVFTEKIGRDNQGYKLKPTYFYTIPDWTPFQVSEIRTYKDGDQHLILKHERSVVSVPVKFMQENPNVWRDITHEWNKEALDETFFVSSNQYPEVWKWLKDGVQKHYAYEKTIREDNQGSFSRGTDPWDTMDVGAYRGKLHSMNWLPGNEKGKELLEKLNSMWHWSDSNRKKIRDALKKHGLDTYSVSYYRLVLVKEPTDYGVNYVRHEQELNM